MSPRRMTTAGMLGNKIVFPIPPDRPAWQMMGLQPELDGKRVALRRVGKQAHGGKS